MKALFVLLAMAAAVAAQTDWYVGVRRVVGGGACGACPFAARHNCQVLFSLIHGRDSATQFASRYET